jgi:hypothetical protein
MEDGGLDALVAVAVAVAIGRVGDWEEREGNGSVRVGKESGLRGSSGRIYRKRALINFIRRTENECSIRHGASKHFLAFGLKK